VTETGGATLQHLVSQYLIRHRSILDVQSKLNESTAPHLPRARQGSLHGLGDLRGFLSTHLQGEPCERCREILEDEIGTTLFYLAVLCYVTGLDLDTAIRKERDRVSALGVYHLT
jgi:hypothetical protein